LFPETATSPFWGHPFDINAKTNQISLPENRASGANKQLSKKRGIQMLLEADTQEKYFDPKASSYKSPKVLTLRSRFTPNNDRKLTQKTISAWRFWPAESYHEAY
jgi:hypothetical protein